MEIEVSHHAPAASVAHSFPLAAAGGVAVTSLFAAIGPDQAASWVAVASTIAVTFSGLYSKLRENRAQADSAAAKDAAEAWKSRYDFERQRRTEDAAEYAATGNLLKQRIADLEAMIADMRRSGHPAPPPADPGASPN